MTSASSQASGSRHDSPPESWQMAEELPQEQLSGQVGWSVGSEKHDLGECQPCAYRWRPTGCSKGLDCRFCHLCDNGAYYTKKKERVAGQKAMRAHRRALRKTLGPGLYLTPLPSDEPYNSLATRNDSGLANGGRMLLSPELLMANRQRAGFMHQNIWERGCNLMQ